MSFRELFGKEQDRGLKEWKNEKGYLRDTCLAAQDRFKAYLDYYGLTTPDS